MDSQTWEEFEWIPQFLIRNLKSNNFQSPFPVQTAVISAFRTTDRDLAIGFPTGSGKTLSYLIPIISSLYKRVVPRTRAIIIVPTRELTTQVFSVLCCLLEGSDLSCGVLGSTRVFNKTTDIDILITTAFTLSTYLVEKETNVLMFIEYVVLDEGDAILDQPLENWLDYFKIAITKNPSVKLVGNPIQCIPPKTKHIRRILCSATLSRNAKQSEDFQMDYPLVLVSSDRSRYVVPDGIEERFVMLRPSDKPAALADICNKFSFILVFVSTSKRSFKLSSIMKKLLPEFSVQEFSSSISAQQRQKVFEAVRSNQMQLIISTDSLARGVDLPFIDAVVNFDSPESARTYIHRMGRTGRAGNKGHCITFLTDNEIERFKDIVSKIDGSAPVEVSPDLGSYITDDYQDMVKGLDKLKKRTVPKKVL